MALLFPVLVLFRKSIEAGNAAPVFLLSFAFLFVLLIGLIYEWVKGDIDWVKDAVDRQKAFGADLQKRKTLIAEEVKG